MTATDGLVGDVDRLTADLAATKQRLKEIEGEALVVILRYTIMRLSPGDVEEMQKQVGELDDAIKKLSDALRKKVAE